MNAFNDMKRTLVAGLFFTACAMLASGAGFFGSDIKPDNIFTAGPVLPATMKRVLVLPLAHDESRRDLTSGCEMFDAVLQSELTKTKKFEVVSIGTKELSYLTGQTSWTGTEELPANFFDSLRLAHGCDAVLFCQLTTFQAYAPLAAGWRMKLVDVSTQKIIWAADMVFDASDSAVKKDAQEFQREQEGTGTKETSRKFLQTLSSWIYHEPPPATEDQWTILNSPRYFGQYSLVKLLKTLPER
jgi:hypothetical protein